MNKVPKQSSSPKKLLILGSSGLIGHTVSEYLLEKLIVFRVFRENQRKYYDNCFYFKEINYETLNKIISDIKPDFVLNCIGLTKHLATSTSIEYFYPNIVIPRYLKLLKLRLNFKLIHISSDCVFNGQEGNYEEASLPNAHDFYGLSKAISETDLESSAMILRTSTVGFEKGTKNGIVEWFFNSDGIIKGFTKAYFNGVSTLELSKVIWEIISDKIEFENGIFHVTGNTISKYDFLLLLNEVHQARKNIEKDDKFCIDRTLCASQKKKELDRSQKSWLTMLEEMKDYNDNAIFK